MEIEIISFGRISEFIGSQRIEVSGTGNTDELKGYLEKSFPMLRNVKYKLALNNKIVQGNLPILNNDKVAIMPPFSGG